MTNFTPLTALSGGILIGLAALLFLLIQGRVAGISGILAGLLAPATPDTGWRWRFIGGLGVGGALGFWLLGLPAPELSQVSWHWLLVGGLLVMVMFSGYENFVSQLDISENKEKLNWLGKMDATSLKNKVAASIVAISSIHLLRVFMDAKNVPDNKLMWYVIIHLTFVLSAFVMGYLDRLTRHNH